MNLRESWDGGSGGIRAKNEIGMRYANNAGACHQQARQVFSVDAFSVQDERQQWRENHPRHVESGVIT